MVFSQDLQTNHTPGDRSSTPAYIDQANLQGSLSCQDPSVRLGETGPEYKEIKTLYGENTEISTLLTFV